MEAEFDVIDASGSARFELRRAGELVGFATYRRRKGSIVVQHVETLVQHRGQGFADRLMAGLVEIARREGVGLVPHCSFAVDYFQEHAEHADVVQGA